MQRHNRYYIDAWPTCSLHRWIFTVVLLANLSSLLSRMSMVIIKHTTEPLLRKWCKMIGAGSPFWKSDSWQWQKGQSQIPFGLECKLKMPSHHPWTYPHSSLFSCVPSPKQYPKNIHCNKFLANKLILFLNKILKYCIMPLHENIYDNYMSYNISSLIIKIIQVFM